MFKRVMKKKKSFLIMKYQRYQKKMFGNMDVKKIVKIYYNV